MSKSTPQVPTPANPTTVANAQTTSNIGTAASQQAGNLINQTGPNGSTSYDQTGSYIDPTTGAATPKYTQTNTLDPLSQAVLTGAKQLSSGQLQNEQGLLPGQQQLDLTQQQLSQTGLNAAQQRAGTILPTAQTLATQAGTSTTTPLNFNTADSGILNTAPQQLSDQAADAVYNKQAGYLDPQFTQSQKDLEDKLSRQGIPVGSDAYNSAMTNFNNTKNQAYGAARDSATAGGATSASQLFNMAQLGQNQNISQQVLAQQNPLQLLGQILNGANV